MKILLIEDDKVLAEGLIQALGPGGFDTHWQNTGQGGINRFFDVKPDIVILDLGLPDMDGVEVLNQLRDSQERAPILILTARDSLDDKVRAFDIGADDYLVKPFEVPELIARLGVWARRLGLSNMNNISYLNVALDIARHRVEVDGLEVALQRREFMTLKALMENVGRVQTKDMLEASLYAGADVVGSNTIEVHISHLRKKLPDGFIKTIRGVGYTLVRDPEGHGQ
jgi:two-component system, OmpR family, response regulator